MSHDIASAPLARMNINHSNDMVQVQPVRADESHDVGLGFEVLRITPAGVPNVVAAAPTYFGALRKATSLALGV